MSNDFFKVLPVDEVVELLQAFPRMGEQSVPLEDAWHRVLAADVRAPEDLPMANRAAMDGYAVRAADTFGASEANPAYLDCVGRVDIETPATFAVQPGQCAAIVTGGILPEGTDAVMMVEYTHELGAGTIEMRRTVPPAEHVMLRGEDAVAGGVALPAGTPVRAQEVGLLAAVGAVQVVVRKQPRVAILSTGDEIIPAHETPRMGQVRDVNSHTLACLARHAGAEVELLGIVPDNLEALAQALRLALQRADVVLLSGGSSVGVRDFTVGALQQLGNARVLCHGVALSPGKPLILADAGGKAVWGLPGQVTSAQVVMLVLGQPFLRHLAGRDGAFEQQRWPARRAVLARNVASRQGREDYVRIRLEARPGQLPQAVPVLGKSGLLRTLTGSHGVVRIASGSEGLLAGTEVDVLLFEGGR